MAQFTRVNGDLQAVFHLDTPAFTNNGVNALTANVAVQLQGPKLDFFTATGNGSLTTTQVATGVQTIQQLSTIYLYQYGNSTNNTFAVALYPAGAWTASTLQTALLATSGPAWPVGSTVATGATFLSGSDS